MGVEEISKSQVARICADLDEAVEAWRSRPSTGPVTAIKAVIESFWPRMQVELLDRQRCKTRIELANAVFEYLEITQALAPSQRTWHVRPVEYENRQLQVVT